MLCQLDEAPALEILRLRQIGNGAVVPAGDAKLIWLMRRDQPIACFVHSVLAKAIASVALDQRLPRVPCGAQRRDGLLTGQITKSCAAAFALGILEIERLATILAFEQLHGPSGVRPELFVWRTVMVAGIERFVGQKVSAAR